MHFALGKADAGRSRSQEAVTKPNEMNDEIATKSKDQRRPKETKGDQRRPKDCGIFGKLFWSMASAWQTAKICWTWRPSTWTSWTNWTGNGDRRCCQVVNHVVRFEITESCILWNAVSVNFINPCKSTTIPQTPHSCNQLQRLCLKYQQESYDCSHGYAFGVRSCQKLLVLLRFETMLCTVPTNPSKDILNAFVCPCSIQYSMRDSGFSAVHIYIWYFDVKMLFG